MRKANKMRLYLIYLFKINYSLRISIVKPTRCTSFSNLFYFWNTTLNVYGYGLDDPGIESRWGARFSSPVQTGPGAHPAPCTMGTASFPGVKSVRAVMLTLHPLLVPWSRKGRAIPLLPLWAIRPYRSSVPVQGCTLLTFYWRRVRNY